MNVAIDGPSGSGKSSVAKRVAKILSFIYVDTGALYRSIGLYALRKGIKTTDTANIIGLLSEIKVEFKYLDGIQRVILNNEDVSDLIRTQKVSMAASNVSAISHVRDFLMDLQRDIANNNNVIMDGRDIGTVILPNADVKIFLTATPETRAMRRFLELKESGLEKDGAYERILGEIKQRDFNDMTRAVAPLKQADDAVLLDNSEMDEDLTLKKVLEIIRGTMDV